MVPPLTSCLPALTCPPVKRSSCMPACKQDSTARLRTQCTGSTHHYQYVLIHLGPQNVENCMQTPDGTHFIHNYKLEAAAAAAAALQQSQHHGLTCTSRQPGGTLTAQRVPSASHTCSPGNLLLPCRVSKFRSLWYLQVVVVVGGGGSRGAAGEI
jgi:hypothetical protein